MADADQVPSPSRRWPQLRLSTLFCLTALVAVGLAGFLTPLQLSGVNLSKSDSSLVLAFAYVFNFSVSLSGPVCAAASLLFTGRLAPRFMAAGFLFIALLKLVALVNPIQNLIGDFVRLASMAGFMAPLNFAAAFACIGLLIERVTIVRTILAIVTFYFAGFYVCAILYA